MTPTRKKRLIVAVLIVAGVSVAAFLGLRAFRGNVLYYFTPSQIAAGHAPLDQRFRVGGLVVKGSVERQPGSMTVHFKLTDLHDMVPVSYTGILPDLFREGQGIVAHGRLKADGTFVADEVLAKHDEKYMPPEVAAELKQTHQAGKAKMAGQGAG